MQLPFCAEYGAPFAAQRRLASGAGAAGRRGVAPPCWTVHDGEEETVVTFRG
eukprot:gene11185-21407_t